MINMINNTPLACRAQAYISAMPAAISGRHGHDATFAVAKRLMHDFALSEPAAWPIFLDYNARCQPPWSERELRHKLHSAGSLTRVATCRGHLRHKIAKPMPPAGPAVSWTKTPAPLPKKPDAAVAGMVSAATSGVVGASPAEDLHPEAKAWANRSDAAPVGPATGGLGAFGITGSGNDVGGLNSGAEEARAAGSGPNVNTDTEARRIAAELVKLHKAGAIKSRPDTSFYANLLLLFGASFTGRDEL
jgi:hypothetical protein